MGLNAQIKTAIFNCAYSVDLFYYEKEIEGDKAAIMILIMDGKNIKKN